MNTIDNGNEMKHKTIDKATKDIIIKPRCEASFHGEAWYRCPYCQSSYEYYDVIYERGFKKVNNDKVYRHEKCGGLIQL